MQLFFSLLQSEYEKMKGKLEEQLNSRLESKTKGIEKIMMENERLRKDIKKVFLFIFLPPCQLNTNVFTCSLLNILTKWQETEAAEKLRVTKASLEVTNEKLQAELEETNQRLLLAQSRGPSLEGADGKTWKSSVVTRYYILTRSI